MTKHKRDKKKEVSRKPSTAGITVPDFTKSRDVKRQVSVLARLTSWQKKSAETDWIIGEYLDN